MNEVDEETEDKLTFFKEKNAVLSLIYTVCSDQWSCSFSNDFLVLTKILEAYLEQPQLLASSMIELVNPLNSRLLTITDDYLTKIDNVDFKVIFNLIA
jgi:hypothetical protein